jgi:hypothetical protein
MKEMTMATKTMTTDTRTRAELEEAVRAGDTTITAEQLAAAADRERHAELLAEAEQLRTRAAAEAARHRDVEALRSALEALDDGREDMRRLAVTAAGALQELFAVAKARGDALDGLARRARELGIEPMQIDDEIRDASGVGWRKDWTTVGPARIRLDDTMLTAVAPTKLLARVVVDALVKVGARPDALPVANPGPPVEMQINDQVRVVAPERKIRVRVTRRWGRHQAGAVIDVDATNAGWAISKGYAKAV